ncbi:MAG: cobyrinate a,c-diamide synthase [Chromatiaceae bacterium]|nr:MAG: cobyrinate a,c-diamide synthase [Chromatiaceae bacterium]
MPPSCPALFIAAPASGQGKTTITAGLARLHRRAGRRVRVFKTGPDFLDPMILARAAGAPVYNLDLWMGGADHCRDLLARAAQDCDLILVEGVMGLYDGNPSGADLAAAFGLPVLLVIEAAAMAQTFAAIALGLATLATTGQPAPGDVAGSAPPALVADRGGSLPAADAGLRIAGVLANQVAGPGHRAMLTERLPATLPFLGALGRDAQLGLPHRYLGLWQAAEIADLERRLDQIADALASTALATLPAPVSFSVGAAEPAPSTTASPLAGCRIAVARDLAFAFLYQANLDLLADLGARLLFFSPLADQRLPDCDALYLPGGYPELHLNALAANTGMRAAIRDHQAAGHPLLAECGGLLYLLDQLSDRDGNQAAMLGLLPGQARLTGRLANLGLQAVTLPEGTLRGHTFHHSAAEIAARPIATAVAARHHGRGEPVYRQGRLTASYLHLYFPSNPAATARLFLP